MVDWVRLELDVEKFDDAEFEPYLHRARTSGTRLTTMAELGSSYQLCFNFLDHTGLRL